MSPVSHKFDLTKAEKYLKSAIQFTPQYGDSFLELFRLYTLKGENKKIEELKNTCVHSEPNYGVLWFYFKHNINDTALDIWNRATEAIADEVDGLRLVYKSKMKDAPVQPASTKTVIPPLPVSHNMMSKSSSINSDFWTGYTALNKFYTKGINSCSITSEEKWRNIYSFERILK